MDLKAAREKTIRDHMELENAGEWDAVIATFQNPRYEFQTPRPGARNEDGLGIYDGHDEVMDYFRSSRGPFPDLGNEILHVVVGDGDVGMVEFNLVGTHLGPIRTPAGEVAPTGKRIKVRMAATFEFAPGSDKIISERPYTDPRAIMAQLGLS